jgi:hypothetical protein
MSAACHLANLTELPPKTFEITIWLRGELRDRDGKGSGIFVEWLHTVTVDDAGLIDLRVLLDRCYAGRGSGNGGEGGYAWVDAYFDRMHLARWRGGRFEIDVAGLATINDLRKWNRLSLVANTGFRPRDLGEGFSDV